MNEVASEAPPPHAQLDQSDRTWSSWNRPLFLLIRPGVAWIRAGLAMTCSVPPSNQLAHEDELVSCKVEEGSTQESEPPGLTPGRLWMDELEPQNLDGVLGTKVSLRNGS